MIHEFIRNGEKIFYLHSLGKCYPFMTLETAMKAESFGLEKYLCPDICPLEILECARIPFQIAVWTMAEEAIQ